MDQTDELRPGGIRCFLGLKEAKKEIGELCLRDSSSYLAWKRNYSQMLTSFGPDQGVWFL